MSSTSDEDFCNHKKILLSQRTSVIKLEFCNHKKSGKDYAINIKFSLQLVMRETKSITWWSESRTQITTSSMLNMASKNSDVIIGVKLKETESCSSSITQLATFENLPTELLKYQHVNLWSLTYRYVLRTWAFSFYRVQKTAFLLSKVSYLFLSFYHKVTINWIKYN